MANIKARTARAIEMSVAGKVKWQEVLSVKGIRTATELMSRIIELAPKTPPVVKKGKLIKTTIDSEATAKKALKGQKTDKPIWELLFRCLELNGADFFPSAEWFGYNREDRWEMLLNMADDASDRFGIVLPQKLEHAGFEDMFTSQKIQKTVPSGKSVLLEIPEGLSGYAIVLEKGVSGNIVLVAPSCLMVDSAVKGELRLLPQYPPSPHQFLVPRMVGTNDLWMGTFAQLPDWEWLYEERQGLLKLEAAHVTQLLEYAAQPLNTKQIWKSSYTVTAV
jgi:hypothetical protein